ncbi:hypothetical protein [Tenacibaculum agarivorans]|uniref:hypothetical protein n=1 Tax=Tenacibaculum agarivorans TaxID=1908389 RepID=UPI000B0539AB|nr:hypothetical protein [Tenacibaculum agarivorans]
MRYILTIILFFSVKTFVAQEFIQLIGIESDHSEFSEGSYTVMYDSESKKKAHKKYTPYQTIGIYRNKDSVSIQSISYLLIPTKRGFLYGTTEVIEVKEDDESEEMSEMITDEYKLFSSVSKPKFFRSKKSIQSFIENHNPTFEQAIQVDFEKISFVNSKFYITRGFESIVHGGATWFNATEKVNIYALDWKGSLSNKLTDYVSNEVKNKVVIETVSNLEGYGFGDEVSAETGLPWAGTINNHNKVFYDINFGTNGIQIIPLTFLWGNSSRSFLAEGNPIKNQKMYQDLQLSKSEENIHSKEIIVFNSPDNLTRIELKNKTLIVIDSKRNKVLKKVKLNYNKIIMSEFALGKYARKWKNEF